MKRILLIVLAVAGIGTARAGHNTSELCLSMENNAMFSVAFDGAEFYQPSASYNFPNISGGSHKLMVWKWVSSGWHCPPKKKLVFNSCVNIPAGHKVIAHITHHGSFCVTGMYPIIPPPPPPPVACCPWHGEHGGHCGDGHGHGYDPEPDEWDYGYGGYGGYKAPMSPQSFQSLKAVIAGKSFDQTRLAIAKQALNSNFVTSAQVSELMNMMTFESTKLELAKAAYGRTVDQGNYYLVNHNFTFSSSVKELEDYIY